MTHYKIDYKVYVTTRFGIESTMKQYTDDLICYRHRLKSILNIAPTTRSIIHNTREVAHEYDFRT
jgi:hypothetical protein